MWPGCILAWAGCRGIVPPILGHAVLTAGTTMTLHHSADLQGIEVFLNQQRRRESRLRHALQRILSAAEGDPRFTPMNWTDVAALAREALRENERMSTGNPAATTNS